MHRVSKIIFILSLLMIANGLWADVPNPTDLLQNVSNSVIAQLKVKKTTLKSNPDYVYSIIRKTLLPHVDTDLMSEKALTACGWGKKLNEVAVKRCEARGITPATAQQQQQFVQLFETLLVYTYSSALAAFSDNTVTFYPIRGGYQNKTMVEVDSEITQADGPSIPVLYHMVLRDNQWRVYDMSVEGISIVESFRSQFVNELQHGGMDALLQMLTKHNARVEAMNRKNATGD